MVAALYMAHPSSRTRIFLLLFIALHALAVVGVWWAMPGGFPADHPRFWSNRVVPAGVIVYAVAIFALATRRRWAGVTILLLLSPIVWIGAAIGGMLIFPISGRWPAVAAMVVAVTVLLAIRRHFAGVWPSRRTLAAIAVPPLVIGAILPLTQRSPLPDTRPIGPAIALPTTRPLDQMLTTQRINDIARVIPSTGQVMTEFGGRSVWVSPLLTFVDHSPDRCWTNLVSRKIREGPRRQLCSFGFGAWDWEMTYLDDGYTMLSVGDHHLPPLSVAMTAGTMLPRAVYSHLNVFSEVSISGHKKLSLIFSPAPDKPIDVTYGEYPIGRPQRSAYLGADGVFRVVEATSGEKGPFHELASGPLARDAQLTITLLDQGVPFARLTFADFAAQAGTQLSPTGGWGYPVNAIEFRLEANSDKAMASLFLTLASTSVGRGWDSVGHGAGMYRNQITIEYIKPFP